MISYVTIRLRFISNVLSTTILLISTVTKLDWLLNWTVRNIIALKGKTVIKEELKLFNAMGCLYLGSPIEMLKNDLRAFVRR